jgi:hypothetical protein
MYRHRTPGYPDELARLAGAVLVLLVDPDDHRPWSETEIAREISTPGSIPECLERLRDDGLVHRCCGLVIATHAAVRCDEIDDGRCSCEAQRSLEDAILALMLGRAEDDASFSRQDVVAVLGEDRRVAVIDALDSMCGAGVIDRSGELVKPSRAALSYSRIEMV